MLYKNTDILKNKDLLWNCLNEVYLEDETPREQKKKARALFFKKGGELDQIRIHEVFREYFF